MHRNKINIMLSIIYIALIFSMHLKNMQTNNLWLSWADVSDVLDLLFVAQIFTIHSLWHFFRNWGIYLTFVWYPRPDAWYYPTVRRNFLQSAQRHHNMSKHIFSDHKISCTANKPTSSSHNIISTNITLHINFAGCLKPPLNSS